VVDKLNAAVSKMAISLMKQAWNKQRPCTGDEPQVFDKYAETTSAMGAAIKTRRHQGRLKSRRKSPP
jgi:hypothetical protein